MEFGDEGLNVLVFLNEEMVDMGASFFKLTLQANNKKALEPPLTYNHVTKLWPNLSSNVVLNHQLFEYFELVEFYVVMVLGTMEDE